MVLSFMQIFVVMSVLLMSQQFPIIAIIFGLQPSYLLFQSQSDRGINTFRESALLSRE